MIFSVCLMANTAERFELGSSVKQIKNKYGKPVTQGVFLSDNVYSNVIIYNTKFAGKNAQKVYYYSNGVVYITAVFFKTSKNYKNFITYYNYIQKLLNVKYGEFKNRNTWSTNLFKNNDNSFSEDFNAGNITLINKNKIGNIEIIHKAQCVNLIYNHVIYYKHLKLYNNSFKVLISNEDLINFNKNIIKNNS